jgi:hypothetical protein
METFAIIATVCVAFILLFWFIRNLREENRRLLKRQEELLIKIEEGQNRLSKTMYKLDLEERQGLKTLEEISKKNKEEKEKKPEQPG